MSNFKSKNTKKPSNNKTKESLDCKHDDFLLKFHGEETTQIPNLMETRLKLLEQFKLESTSFDEKLEIKHKIKDIDAKLNELKKSKNKYLLSNSKYIFEYFENKKSISAGN